jgi:hypothetical protein
MEIDINPLVEWQQAQEQGMLVFWSFLAVVSG